MFQKPNTKKPHPKVAIFGAMSSGKTAFALSAGQKDKPVAVIDTEAGTAMMASGFRGPGGEIVVPNMEVLHAQTPSKLIEALDYLEKHADKFSALVIDSATVIWQMAQDSFVSSDTGRIKLNEWNAVKLPINRVYHRIMRLPLPIIFSCRLKEVFEKDGKEMKRVGFAPDFEKAASYVFDLVLHFWGPEHNFAVSVFKSRMHELPYGTRLDDLTWNSLMGPIAYRFDSELEPVGPGYSPEAEGKALYGNNGTPQVSKEEILQKITEAKALAHLKNIATKYKPTAKAGGWINELTAAFKAKESSFVNPAPPVAEEPPATGASEQSSEPPVSEVPVAEQEQASKYRSMTFEELMPVVSTMCVGAGTEFVGEFAAAVGGCDAAALADLAERVEVSQGKAVA